jgi:eukaryotic-like serine/threonine-protein kinase
VQDGDDTLAGRDSGPRTGDDTVVGEPAAPVGRRVGDLVGRYVLLERIGQGGMGVVHRAYDPELDRHVALKLLRAGSRAGAPEGARLRLLREAQALAKLSHNHVVAVFDVGTTVDEVFLAMELVEGIDLWSRLRNAPARAGGGGRDGAGRAQPMPWREAVRVLAAAGQGLAAAHDLGLVHRDFKPGNVLLAKDGGVLVTDFGLARVDDATSGRFATVGNAQVSGRFATVGDAPPSDKGGAARSTASGKFATVPRPATSGSAWLEVDLTIEGALMGTPAYMAPEQHRGVAADARADQYAFATTLWECVYGQRPFHDVAPEDLGVRKAAGPPHCPLRPSVPAWIRRVLQRALLPQPDARFPDMHAMLRAIEEGPRRRRIAIVAGASALAVAGAIAFVVRSGTREDPCPPASGETDETVLRWAGMRTDVDAALAERMDGLLAQRSTALRDSCRATFVLGERSRQWFVDRERCAERQAIFVDAALGRLAAADAHGAAMIDAIPAIDDCDEAATGLAALPEIADARMLLAAGAVVDAIVQLGDVPMGAESDASIEADALRARASSMLGQPRDAEARLLSAVARARGAGRARLEARLWAALGRLALAETRTDAAALVVDLAEAAAPAEPGDALAGELAAVRAELALVQDDRETACERFGAAIDALARAHGREHGAVIEAEEARTRACEGDTVPTTQ